MAHPGAASFTVRLSPESKALLDELHWLRHHRPHPQGEGQGLPDAVVEKRARLWLDAYCATISACAQAGCMTSAEQGSRVAMERADVALTRALQVARKEV